MHTNPKLARLGRPLCYGLAVVAFLVLMSATAPSVSALDDNSWWDGAWEYEIKLTIDNSKIDDNLENFPVLVRLDNSNFTWTHAIDNGDDIRFVDNAGVELKYERERHDNDNGYAEYWVKVPSISDTENTNFYMYYGNPDATDGADPTNVWDDNYVIVYHMDDNATGSAVLDSTSGSNYGTKEGGASDPVEVSGWIGRAQELDGTSDSEITSAANTGITGATPRTLEFWAKSDDVNNYRPMVTWGTDLNDYSFMAIIYGSSTPYNWYFSAWADDYDTGTTADTEWHHHAIVYDGSHVDWYENGDNLGAGADKTLYTSISPLYVGGRYDDSYNFDGIIDEVRVSNTARSAAWIKAIFNSENNTLLTVGSEGRYEAFAVGTVAADNTLIDRDIDYSGSGAVAAAQLRVEVSYPITSVVESENVRFVIYDAADDIVDNAQADDNYIQVTDNTRRFFHTYVSIDNTLSDSQLGAWDVRVEATDNENNVENATTSNVFTVDDLYVPVDLSPDDAVIGYGSGADLTASGAIARVSGSTSVDNSWLYDENAGQLVLGASNSYSQSYTITAASGTDNIYVRVRAVDSMLDGENTAFYDVNENSWYAVSVYWEPSYTLVPDGSGENAIENRNYHLTFFFEDRTSEYDMTTNPENFVIPSNLPEKLRIDVVDDNYWRTRTLEPSPSSVDMIVVENAMTLDQYKFLLKDLTGEFGYDDNGQLVLSSYVGDDLLYIHDDFWDAEDSVTVFLVYGGEYNLAVANPTEERGIARVTADRDLTKEILVGVIEPTGTYAMIWDSVAWIAWWDGGDLKVYYQDNTDGTENVVVWIYDENDDNVHQQTFTSSEWTLTWVNAEENVPYVIEIEINHGTLDPSNLTTSMVLSAIWVPPVTPLPGMGQLGELPFAWGSGIAVFLTVMIALTFGARHAGFCVMTIGIFLIVLGPIMGFYPASAEATALMAFLMVMGVIMMLTRKGD